MQIRLDKLGDERFTWRETLDLGVGELDNPDVRSVGPVGCRGSSQPSTSGYVVRIRMKYPQVLQCVRCLEECSFEVAAELDLLVGVEEEGDGGESAGELEELSSDDLGVLILPEPIFDTRPLVAEQVQLGIPMKPLCREECAGLCGQCGASLAEGPCDCRPVIDSRWAALAKLLPSDS
ncbi:MAG: YceD family protein [Holophagales bacterium]|nr:YceD family protein [Holophagales bacterium]